MEQIEIQKTYINKVFDINKDKKLSYSILTMGCQLNENDSEKISGMVEKMGYNYTANFKNADLVILNTCCVRENAEDRLFGKLGELKKSKKQYGTIIAIGGCMMQEKHIQNKIKQSYPFVDIVFGTHTLHRLPEDIYKAIIEKKKIDDIIDIDGEIYEGIPIKRNDNIKASVTIMYGCNNFCTYCIVPYVRGRERSRNSKDIINEIKDLAQKGYKEIMLLGQNVNSYDGGNGYKFANLLRDVNCIKGLEKIRFISPHPKDFTPDVIAAIKECKNVSKNIHLPLQSGSTNILKAMNRKYSKEQYIELVNKIKNEVSGVTFSTDIIVGFPGETKEDFNDTLDVVKKVGFEQVYMFIYSRRVGTIADKMENQISEEVKHIRFNELKELVEKQMEKRNEEYVGSIQNILVEGTSKTNKDLYTGRTDSNKVVVFSGNKSMIGKIINCEITKNCLWYLQGKVIN